MFIFMYMCIHERQIAELILQRILKDFVCLCCCDELVLN